MMAQSLVLAQKPHIIIGKHILWLRSEVYKNRSPQLKIADTVNNVHIYPHPLIPPLLSLKDPNIVLCVV